MFCLMDVSASMGEREKDLAKRFFILLHLFLKRKYERVDIVFIRHTHEAAEVDEQEFFYGRETGGTVVSSALEDDDRGAREALSRPPTGTSIAPRRPTATIRRGDSRDCVALLDAVDPAADAILRLYRDRRRRRDRHGGRGKDLWRAYAGLKETRPNFAMARVAGRADIYPVFRKLFARQPKQGAAP